MAEMLMTKAQLEQVVQLMPASLADSFRTPADLHSATVASSKSGSHGTVSGLAKDEVIDDGQFSVMLTDARGRASDMFDDHRNRANRWFLLMSVAAVAGLFTILAGAIVSLTGATLNGGLAALAGVLVEAIGFLFFRNWTAICKDLRAVEASLAVIETADLSLRMISLMSSSRSRDATIVDLIKTMARINHVVAS